MATNKHRTQPPNQATPRDARNDGRALEQIVKRLEAAIGDDCEVMSPDWLPDKSGSRRKRQVDVSVRRKVGSQLILIINECRDHRQNVHAPYVESIATKRDDVGASKAVIISAKGFSEGAIKKAALHDIALMTIHEATEQDWQQWITTTPFLVYTRRSNLKHVQLNVNDRHRDSLERWQKQFPRNLGDSLGSLKLFKEDGTEWGDLASLLNTILAERPEVYDLAPQGQDVLVPVHLQGEPLCLRLDDEQLVPLEGLSIVGEFWIETAETPIRHWVYREAGGKHVADYAEAKLTFPTTAGQPMGGRLYFVRGDAGMKIMFEPDPTAVAGDGQKSIELNDDP